MPMWSQHVVVLLIVAGCALFVLWQARSSLLGRCCSKGCRGRTGKDDPDRRIFIPIETLRRRK